jgi:hypothetical protein
MPTARSGLLLGGLVAVLLLLPAAPAAAKLQPGVVAPEFGGKDWFKTEATTLKDQRGRLVFLELFSTG